jgi:hypothetical protein
MCRCAWTLSTVWGAYIEVETLIGTDVFGRDAQEHLDGLVRSLEVSVLHTTDAYDSLLRAVAAVS